MLAWVMNLGFAASSARPSPPLGTSTSGGSQRHDRRGGLWQPQAVPPPIDYRQREMDLLKAQEKVLQQQLKPRSKRGKKAMPISAEQRQRIEETLRRLIALRQEKELELEPPASAQAAPPPPAPIAAPPPLVVRAHPAAVVPRIDIIAQERALRARREAEQALAAAAAAAEAKALLIRRRDEEAMAVVMWLALFDE